MTDIDVQTYDHVVPEDQRKEIWQYINKQKWYATWKPMDGKTFEYIPENVPPNFVHGMPNRTPTMWMHRAGLASDECGLKKDHPLIWRLWCTINSHLGNKYTITGNDEEISSFLENSLELQAPPPADSSLSPGWRVYTNGQLNENVKRSHGIHRDTRSVDDTTSRTILYVANLEWYPSWFAECIFYPDDEIGETGDHQQFQKKWFNQGRDFKIGWADNGKIVSPVPGRIISYEGRTLHTTRPAAIWAKEIRKVIAFRVRKIS